MQHYPKHYCGIFGVYGHPKAANLAYYGLYALQHRGQESAGIVSCDGKQFRVHKGMHGTLVNVTPTLETSRNQYRQSMGHPWPM